LICRTCRAQPISGAAFCHNCGSVLVPSAAGVSSGASPWTLADIGKAIGFVVAGLIGVWIPASILALVLAGGGDIEDDPAALSVSLGRSVFLELFLLGSAVHFTMRKYGLSVSALGLKLPARGGFWLTLGLALALVIAGLGINLIYFADLGSVGIEPDTDIKQAYQSAAPLITLAIVSLMFAPLMEEVFFRGFVFGGLRGRWGTGWAAAGSGLLFALAHIGNPGTIYLIPPVAAIGVIFALGYNYSGSIMASFLAHFLFNSFALVAGIAEYS